MHSAFLHDHPEISKGLDYLLNTHKQFGNFSIERSGFQWPKFEEGFPGLVRIVLGQQVSTHAANAMWQKLLSKTNGKVTPDMLCALDENDFKETGFSRQKKATVLNLVHAVQDNSLDFDRLCNLSDTEVTQALTAYKGLGVWSARMYLIFCLARSDVWAPDDLGVREGLRLYLESQERPDQKLAETYRNEFSPYCTSACLLLWKIKSIGDAHN